MMLFCMCSVVLCCVVSGVMYSVVLRGVALSALSVLWCMVWCGTVLCCVVSVVAIRCSPFKIYSCILLNLL